MTKHKNTISGDLPPISLYVHTPWCVQKCPYCDFNSHAIKQKPDESAYLDALLSSLNIQLDYLYGRQIDSIFVGGGTPSLLSPVIYQKLLDVLRQRQVLATNAEITLEANPGTADSDHFSGYRAAGINRLSIGVQSLNNQHLQQLGRIHDAAQAKMAFDMAREAGFENINCDLMYGLPGQTEAQALDDLQQILDWQPEHLSWYQLTIEPNTAFHAAPPTHLPDNDTLWDLQQAGQALIAKNSYHQYEISAYSLDDAYRCKHNLNYWQFGDYLAIGAGAHGKISTSNGVFRFSQPRHPEAYVKSPQTAIEQQALQAEDIYCEFLLNSLRLNQDFDTSLYHQRTQLNPDRLIEHIRQDTILNELLICENGRIYTSQLGQQHLNETIQRCCDLWPQR